MKNEELVKMLLSKLETVDQFSAKELIAGHENGKGEANLALWEAMELSAANNRRFGPTMKDGIYKVIGPEKRLKRVQSRVRAAGRILGRNLEEVRRIDPAVLTPEQKRSLARTEARLEDKKVRSSIAEREAGKKRPAGL